MEAQRVHSPSYAVKSNLPVQTDPRLMSPRSQKQPGSSSGTRASPRQPLTPNQSHLPPPQGQEAPATGAAVPSIVTLMNGPATSPYSKLNGSPSSLQVEGPKDIPTDKIGFGGEDMRALRQLDRVFTA